MAIVFKVVISEGLWCLVDSGSKFGKKQILKRVLFGMEDALIESWSNLGMQLQGVVHGTKVTRTFFAFQFLENVVSNMLNFG